jgi:Calcineurin-like phosphoesterase
MNINKKKRNKNLSLSDIHYSLISTLVVVVAAASLCFSISSDNEILGIEDKQKNNLENIKQQNATLAFGKNHFIAVGDWYCNKETEKTIENILAIDPEVIITTGDHVKDEKSAKCWIDMSEKIKDKMKIAIGNHDRDSSMIYKQITKNHNLTTPYYSHDFKNIHFISLSTEHPYEDGSKQYEFIKNDLEKTSKNSSIEWIIVHQHKPLYSSKNDKEEAKELRITYHPLFEKYDVDLVISSHNQYYERTYPLLYNSESDEYPIFIKDNFSSNYYHKSDGIIFLTVGTAGDELQDIEDQADYYAIQDDEEFGFLDLKLENNGKTLIGEFHTNKGDIIDHFELNYI